MKEIREFLGLTQSQFAALLGKPETTIGRRERKQHAAAMGWDEIVLLDKALAEKGRRLSDFTDPQTQDA